MAKKIAVFLIILSLNAAAQLQFNPNYDYDPLDSLLMRGIDKVYGENFDEALAIFDSVVAIDPESPRGYFFVAACYNNLMGDYRNFKYEPLFVEHIDRAIKIGEARESSGKATAEDLFYYGGAVGYRGIFRSFRGDWIGAFKDGLRGRGILNNSFKADTVNKDIYLGLGTYDYWRSAKTKLLWWTPFFGDNRQKGIDEIKIVTSDGKFAAGEANYALIRIYYDYGKYDSLINHWQNKAKKLNPDDPFSLYWVGLGYIKLNKYDEALKSFETVLKVYLGSPYYDQAGEMECRYYMGYCQHYLGDRESSARNLEIARRMSLKLADRKDMEDTINSLNAFLKEIQHNKK